MPAVIESPAPFGSVGSSSGARTATMSSSTRASAGSAARDTTTMPAPSLRSVRMAVIRSAGLVAVGATVGQQLLVADLDQRRLAGQRGGQAFAGQVDRDRAAVGHQVRGEPAVQRGGHDPVVVRAGQQRDPVLSPSDRASS